ncbi:MAG: histidine kinase, partial [Bacteroidia bacterium]|nr:histidine kinase [Bacteroidia bacterium]
WLANIGGAYQVQGDSANVARKTRMMTEMSAKALEYYTKALKLSEELGNNYTKANILSDIGAINITKKLYNEAEEFLRKSLDVATKINAFDVIMAVYQHFYELYKHIKKPSKALEYYEKYAALKNSIFNENTKKIISELQIKYQTEKKEAENKLLSKQNEIQKLRIRNSRYLIIGLVGLCILILSACVLLIRQNKLRTRQLAIQLEQKLLRTQMNPHFIFNALASIESFIYEHRPKEAGTYLSTLSRLIQLILENSASEYITLEKETEILNSYLSLQKLRFDDDLEYNIEIDKSIVPEQIYLPPMLLQPFIENAIEHGFRGTKQKGFISVLFSIMNNNLEVRITDNGIGITTAEQQKAQHKIHRSMAMQITRERLKYLNKSKKQKLNFNVRDILNENQENTGTEIIFSIPLP